MKVSRYLLTVVSPQCIRHLRNVAQINCQILCSSEFTFRLTLYLLIFLTNYENSNLKMWTLLKGVPCIAGLAYTDKAKFDKPAAENSY